MGHAEPRHDDGMPTMGTLVNFNATALFSPATSASGPSSGGTTGGVSTLSQDSVSFGTGGISDAESQKIVLERAFEKLRAVVDDARAELGIPEGAVVDTSAEATARRIVEFEVRRSTVR